MRLLRVILLSLCFAIAGFDGFAARPGWEQVQSPQAVTSRNDDGNEERVDVTVRDGYIYVTTPRPVTVRVMTILGQLISQQNLPEGTSRLKVTSRGIYILKAGSQTHRVTI